MLPKNGPYYSSFGSAIFNDVHSSHCTQNKKRRLKKAALFKFNVYYAISQSDRQPTRQARCSSPTGRRFWRRFRNHTFAIGQSPDGLPP